MTNDVLIIGGGMIGLACGLELKLRGANVTVLSRDFTAAASHAAAGMLAPKRKILLMSRCCLYVGDRAIYT